MRSLFVLPTLLLFLEACASPRMTVSTSSSGMESFEAMSTRAKLWLEEITLACITPTCRYGTAVVSGVEQVEACKLAKREARGELARAVSFRVRSVFEDTVADLNGTSFQNVRSQIEVSTDVEFEGAAPPVCMFDRGRAYAFASIDFGPKIIFLEKELQRRRRVIDQALANGRRADFDEAFVAYARAVVEAINADDERIWLVGLDPKAAGRYSDVPAKAFEAIDGLLAKARLLRLTSNQFDGAWLGNDSLGVRLEVEDNSQRVFQTPYISFSGSLLGALGYSDSQHVESAIDGIAQISAKGEVNAPKGIGRGVATLDWPRTLMWVRAQLTESRAQKVFDWMLKGLPTVQTSLVVYLPGEDGLMDSLRAILCDGKQDPIVVNPRVRPLQGSFLDPSAELALKLRFQDRLRTLSCRQASVGTSGESIDLVVLPPVLEGSKAEIRLQRSSTGSVMALQSGEPVLLCLLRCAYGQWEAAAKSCSELDVYRGPTDMCLLQSLYYLGQHDEALEVATRRYKTNRTNVEHQVWMGVLSAQVGKYSEALRYLISIKDVSRVKQLSNYWMAVAVSRCRNGEQKKAKEAFIRYLKIPDAPNKQQVRRSLRNLSCSNT